jgi:hypothetical protein
MSTATAAGTTTQLQGRARRLRSQAASLHPLLADTYRRRAAELDVQAWLEAVWNPPLHPLPGLAGGATPASEQPAARGPHAARAARTARGSLTRHLRCAIA